jgi:hypothetical protein
MAIKTTCNNYNCGYDLRNYEVTVELDGRNRSLWCPVCGTQVVELEEVSGLGAFFDKKAGEYFKWSPPQQAAAQPNAYDSQTHGKLTISVRSTVRNYLDIFYEQALVFAQGDGPFDRQCFAPPENCEAYGLEIIDAQLYPDNNYVSARFRLKGDFENTVVLPAFVTGHVVATESALLVWPDFERPEWTASQNRSETEPDASGGDVQPGWNDYFVYFATSDARVKTEWMRVVGKNQGEEARFDGGTSQGELLFTPRYIEICANVAVGSGLSRRYHSCFAVKLARAKQPPRNERKLRLSIDFGTSNTCLFYLIPSLGQNEPDPHPEILRFSDRTLSLVKGLQLEDDLRHTWLPNLSGQDLIPSELVFAKPPETLFGGAELQPVVDYTIPPLKWRKEEQKRISTGFKWQEATEPKKIQYHYRDLQKMYLGLVLRMVAAELAAGENLMGAGNVNPSEVDLIVTYPLSMNEITREDIFNSFRQSRALVRERTGINLAEYARVNESEAGEKGTSSQGVGIKIFVDVGGGTTDICVVNQSAEEGGARLTQVVDSVRYAGNDFLEALASDRGQLSSRPMIELQRRIRIRREKVLEDLSTFDNSNPRKEQAQKGLERFLRGFTQYLARLIALQANKDGGASRKLDVYLLGNGWQFVTFAVPLSPTAKARSATPQQTVVQEMQIRLMRELERFRDANLIKGVPEIDLHHPNDPKTVVARGALEVRTRRRTRQALDDDADQSSQREPQTFMGTDVLVVLPAKSESFSWNTAVPLELEDEAERVSITSSIAGFEKAEVHNPEFSLAPLTRLRDINIGRHVHKDGKIWRNAFNVYLEEWHKRYLTGKWVPPV